MTLDFCMCAAVEQRGSRICRRRFSKEDPKVEGVKGFEEWRRQLPWQSQAHEVRTCKQVGGVTVGVFPPVTWCSVFDGAESKIQEGRDGRRGSIGRDCLWSVQGGAACLVTSVSICNCDLWFSACPTPSSTHCLPRPTATLCCAPLLSFPALVLFLGIRRGLPPLVVPTLYDALYLARHP